MESVYTNVYANTDIFYHSTIYVFPVINDIYIPCSNTHNESSSFRIAPRKYSWKESGADELFTISMFKHSSLNT